MCICHQQKQSMIDGQTDRKMVEQTDGQSGPCGALLHWCNKNYIDLSLALAFHHFYFNIFFKLEKSMIYIIRLLHICYYYTSCKFPVT